MEKLKNLKQKDLETVEQKNGKLSKGVVALAAIGMASTSVFAADTDANQSFSDLYGVFVEWLKGDLGRLLALLGFAGTFIIYLMTHKGSVLIIGIVISLIAGGIVSISDTFFQLGQGSFS